MNYSIKQRHHSGLLKHIFLIAFACIFITSCSTKKNTFVSRTFHNTTAHFNVYWNGEDALKEGYKEWQKNVKDNYTAILPVYNNGTVQEAGQMNAPADRALEKGSTAIQRHSMIFGNREYNKWIDDAYLMMGKAYFYKREYIPAKRTFEFITSTYDNPKTIFAAHLWLVHTLDKSGNFNLSATEMELSRLMVDQGQVRKRKQLSAYNEMTANHYIILQEYEEALPFLTNGIQYAQTSKMRQRLRFISGQIYQELGNCQKASEIYAHLVKKNTTFDIGFNSRINLAKCYAAGSGDSKEIVHELEKMLKETKNEDYLDQVYYALYEVAHASSGNHEKEKEYLRLSVAKSVQNDYQKALSSLTLATVLFDEQDYETSQAYYDTTLQVLPNDYPNYEQIKERGLILTELVSNLLVIRDQDSLQMVAKMSEQERNAHIDKIIKKIAEEELRQAEEERRIAELGYRDPRDRNTINSGGWYFYNPQTVSNGRRDFIRKYGTRKLEDLWIISNKQSFNWESDATSHAAEGENESDTSHTETDVKKREYYLQFLPLTPELMHSSDSMIAIAYFNAGLIYREKLHESKEAADEFKDLIARYPDTSINKNLLLSYYFIIKCYEDIGDNANKQKYINMLTSQFPNSDIAKLIVDPEYYRDMEAKTKSVEALYEKTYLAYTANQFYVVMINADKARSEYPTHKLIPKFDYLQAMSAGKLESRDSTVVKLTRLIDNYPNSEVRPLAETVIAALTGAPYQAGRTGGSAVAGGTTEAIPSIYNTDIKGQQFLVIYLPDVGDMSAVKIRFNDFNEINYKMSGLTVNSVMLDMSSCIISVGLFSSEDAAMKYYHHVMSDNYATALIKQQSGSHVFVITNENYPILYKEKDMTGYNAFFEKYYLKK